MPRTAQKTSKVTFSKPLAKSDKEQANELLAVFKKCQEDMRVLDASMKEAKQRILDMAKKNRQEFTDAGHWELEGGYVKTTEKTVAETTGPFSFKKFATKFSDYLKPSFDITLLKKAWTDPEKQNAFTEMGLELKVQEELDLQVK